jgi:mono/diheme cytochrome c family protein
MHVDDRTWSGYSYEWNGLAPAEKQTQATLLPGEKDKPLATIDGGTGAAAPDGGVQSWHFPSREQCLQCHTAEAGRSLGPTTQQLNFDYPAAGSNQVDAFVARGVFDAAPKKLDAYPAPFVSGSATLEQRARSYMQANCAICHRPGGALMDVDLRYTTPFKNTNLCNMDIVRGTGEGLPTKRLVPGSPSASALSYRMHDLGPNRMPKVGSSVVDKEGSKLVDDWITALPPCAP